MDVSILIVSYNTRELTLRCLETLYEETQELEFEVLVLDNASNDGSAEAIAEQFPEAKLTASQDNLGFAGGNNELARSARGEYLLLLNPDTEVLDGAIQTLVAFARAQPDEVIVGGRTLFADKSLNPSSCWARQTPWSLFCMGSGLSSVFRGSRWFDPESLGPWPRDTVRDVDIISGCLLLIRRENWERLQGFDPAFFMYGEDADLCLRAGRAGIRCVVCPEATIVHHAGASERARAGKMLKLLRAKSQLCDIYWGPISARFGRAMLSLWSLSRCAVFGLTRLVKSSHRQSYATWREVWAGRAAWLDPPTNVE